MTDNGFEASFPVLFFDGNSTMEVGNIYIQPSLTYKMFQSAVSQKIGVSPNQITIYYERGGAGFPLTSPASKIGGNRRTPVTNKFNFAVILRERNCYFFAVFKRSRRERYRKNKRNPPNYPIQDRVYSSEGYDLAFGNYNPSFDATNFPYASVDYLDYTSQVKRLVEIERERFLTSLNLNSNVYSDLDLISRMSTRGGAIASSQMFSDDGVSSSGGVSSTGSPPVCEVCIIAKVEGKTAPFHGCKCDPILNPPFRSPFGPIARPARTTTPSGASLAGQRGWSLWTGWTLWTGRWW